MNAQDLSAAQRAVAEFEILQRELNLARDECRQTREMLAEAQNRLAMEHEESERLREELRTERIRTNRWIVMSTKLTANMGMVETLVTSLKATAIECAQTAAERDLERALSDEEMRALQKLAGTAVPSNNYEETKSDV